MTKTTNQYKKIVCLKSRSAFASFDALLSILVIVIIIVQTISIQFTLSNFSQNALEDQILFDKLTTISEYAVQNLVAKKEISDTSENNIIYPNLVNQSELLKIDSNLGPLAKEAGLNNLSIDWVQKDYRFCIYRLVLYEESSGSNQEIRQLFICGG
ncbi:MAG: hypothetical protein AABX38_02735 [Candidatus Micrarchaeota archaeon]